MKTSSVGSTKGELNCIIIGNNWKGVTRIVDSVRSQMVGSLLALIQLAQILLNFLGSFNQHM